MAKLALIADDDADARTLLQYRLEKRGFSVDVCQNGGEALDKILENAYDLVLLDYFMPILKGDLVCQSIRVEERLSRLPMFIMTGFDHYPENFFLEKGATIVLYKPFDESALNEAIDKHVSLAE